MNNDTTNSGKQLTRMKNIFVLKTNVLHSGIGWLRMRTSSFTYWTAYVTRIYITLVDSTSPYGVTTQKTNIDIFTSVRTPNIVLLGLYF
jgi:hypothetical protein